MQDDPQPVALELEEIATDLVRLTLEAPGRPERFDEIAQRWELAAKMIAKDAKA